MLPSRDRQGATLFSHFHSPPGAGPKSLVHEIGDRGVNVADNHESRGCSHFAGEKIDHQEIKAKDHDSIAESFNNGAFSAGALHNGVVPLFLPNRGAGPRTTLPFQDQAAYPTKMELVV